VFIKDLSTARQREIEELFKDLDTGPLEVEETEDVEDDIDGTDNELDKMMDAASNDKLNLETAMRLRPDSDGNLNNIDSDRDRDIIENMKSDSSEFEMSDSESTENDFRQDIYGLQHDVLMQKVTSAKSKFRPVIMSDGNGRTVDFTDPGRFADKTLVRKEKPFNFKRHKNRMMQQYLDEERLSKEMLERYMENMKSKNE